MSANIEILSTGTELMEGVYADTNSRLISETLFNWGYNVVAHTSVGDDCERIKQVLGIAEKRADVVIMIGGLGPTEDDYTREAVASFCQCDLREDREAAEWIRELFRRRGRSLPAANLKQALIPECALILHNANGTAPGFIKPAEIDRPAIIALPGPRRELIPLLEGPVREWLLNNFPDRTVQRACTLQTTGVPESELNQRLLDLWQKNPRVQLTLLSDPMLVKIRIIGRGSDEGEVNKMLEQYQQEIRLRVGEENILGAGDVSHADAVGQLFRKKAKTLCTAESCTGGMISAMLTDVPGSSAYVLQNFVAYSNEAKQQTLGVSPETLDRHGAVSAECAGEMAEGARRVSGVDIAVSVTGIAGPDGGTPDKPVGLVYFGLSDSITTQTYRHLFPGDRSMIRLWAARTALDLLRRWCLKQ